MIKVKTERDAIDALNIIIQLLIKHDMSDTMIKQLDAIRQFLGRNE